MPHYSYNWSLDVVLAFTEKHARATDLLCFLAEIEHSVLVKHAVTLLMTGHSTKWEAFKRLIRAMSHENKADFRGISLDDRRKYLHICYANAKAEAFNALCDRSEGLDNYLVKN